jgi:hypothetical protein
MVAGEARGMRTTLFAAAAFVVWAGTAGAQIVVSSPPAGTTSVGPADDYATRAFQDPWDMSQYSDLGWMTFGSDQPAVNLSGVSFTGGIFSGTPTSDDPNFWLLDTWLPGSAVLGKIGKRFPIDATKYRVLVLRMRLANQPAPVTGPSQMQVLWSNNTIYASEPNGGLRTSNGVLTYQGWNVYVVDLVSLGSASGPAWSGSVDSLRIDPTQYQAAGQIQLDWARLLPLDNVNMQRTVQWTGTQVVDIFVDDDNNEANGTLGQVAHSANGGGGATKSYGLYIGGFEAGDYYVALRAAGSADPLVYSPGRYRVASPPTLQFTSPSEEGSSDDFATVQLNNAWDMTSTGDVDLTYGLTGLAATTVTGTAESGASLGSVPAITGTSVASAGVGDPVVYWMHWTGRGRKYRIDTDRYRVLTFEPTLPGPRNVLNGSIARVVWKIGDELVENVSQDIVVNHRAGANVFAKIVADMKTLELETVPGGSPSTSGWINGGGSNPGVDGFRVDPHEFSPATSFAFRRVKLAAFERAGASYGIAWTYSNPSAVTATLKLVADLDQAGCDGITIATGLDPALQAYSWTLPVSFNDGESRYICAQVLSGATVLDQVYSRWPVVREVGYTGPLPRLVPERASLRFGAVNSGGTLTSVTPPQQLVVTQVGSGTVSWSASSDQAWLKVTPGIASGTSMLTVEIVNPGGLPASGSLSGRITLLSTDVLNSPQYVDVSFQLKAPGTSAVPFGAFDTPADGTSGITGAIPVTGWALDDVGIDRVEVWRDPVPGFETSGSPNGKIFLGQAYLVAGARPDVEAIYAGTLPRPQLAGWGFMVLTNFLPDRTVVPTQPFGGNGSFVLYAYAVDFDGHTALLGSKGITCDNAHATTPFGTIDTPAQGGTASGASFVNFGWALTPLPATIPTNGSTLWVFVDGAPLGHPTYNQFRSDVAAAFPGYNNSAGPVGYFFLNTTGLGNGTHTIAWSAADNLGRTTGLGSRYFTVFNGSASLLAPGGTATAGDLGQAYGTDLGRDVGSLAEARWTPPLAVDGHEGAPISVGFDGAAKTVDGSTSAYAVVGERLQRLPVGARFDAASSRLTWTPGPGFVGDHEMVLVGRGADGRTTVRPVRVHLGPSGGSGD